MPNLNGLVVRASDFKVAITIPGPPAFASVFLTWENFSDTEDSKTAQIYAGGTDEAIAIKNSEFKYSGRLSIQYGEWSAFMALNGANSVMVLPIAILSVVALNGTFIDVFTGVKFKSRQTDRRRSELETLVNLDWLALSKK